MRDHYYKLLRGNNIDPNKPHELDFLAETFSKRSRPRGVVAQIDIDKKLKEISEDIKNIPENMVAQTLEEMHALVKEKIGLTIVDEFVAAEGILLSENDPLASDTHLCEPTESSENFDGIEIVYGYEEDVEESVAAEGLLLSDKDPLVSDTYLCESAKSSEDLDGMELSMAVQKM